MACNVISCIEVTEITQTLKIADFTMLSGLRTLKIHVKEHVQSFQNMYGKGG